jgi:hypothetical protein
MKSKLIRAVLFAAVVLASFTLASDSFAKADSSEYAVAWFAGEASCTNNPGSDCSSPDLD